ncbi:MAG: hypothetical protein NTX09_03100 [Verrucomicrobia bacterium]|nr:hypothetical protein [Verrucomicrobiota bacterium]
MISPVIPASFPTPHAGARPSPSLYIGCSRESFGYSRESFGYSRESLGYSRESLGYSRESLGYSHAVFDKMQ